MQPCLGWVVVVISRGHHFAWVEVAVATEVHSTQDQTKLRSVKGNIVYEFSEYSFLVLHVFIIIVILLFEACLKKIKMLVKMLPSALLCYCFGLLSVMVKLMTWSIIDLYPTDLFIKDKWGKMSSCSNVLRQTPITQQAGFRNSHFMESFLTCIFVDIFVNREHIMLLAFYDVSAAVNTVSHSIF